MLISHRVFGCAGRSCDLGDTGDEWRRQASHWRLDDLQRRRLAGVGRRLTMAHNTLPNGHRTAASCLSGPRRGANRLLRGSDVELNCTSAAHQ